MVTLVSICTVVQRTEVAPVPMAATAKAGLWSPRPTPKKVGAKMPRVSPRALAITGVERRFVALSVAMAAPRAPEEPTRPPMESRPAER